MPLVVNWALLGKPDFGISRPEGWQLYTRCSDGRVAVAVVIDSSSLIISRVAYSLRQGRQCCLPQLYVQWQ